MATKGVPWTPSLLSILGNKPSSATALTTCPDNNTCAFSAPRVEIIAPIAIKDAPMVPMTFTVASAKGAGELLSISAGKRSMTPENATR